MSRIIIGLLALTLLIACSPATDERLGALEEELSNLSGLESDIEARLVALEAELAGEADPLDVAVAQYIMDTAGFHSLDETLNETQEVEPAQLSTVRRVDKVLTNVNWPEELEAQAGDFLAVLDELAAAMEADNGEEAARLAAEAHEVQHDFSHSIDEWLGAAEHDEE